MKNVFQISSGRDRLRKQWVKLFVRHLVPALWVYEQEEEEMEEKKQRLLKGKNPLRTPKVLPT